MGGGLFFTPKEKGSTLQCVRLYHFSDKAAIIDLPSVCCCSALFALAQTSLFYLPVLLCGPHPHPYCIRSIFVNHNDFIHTPSPIPHDVLMMCNDC